MITIISDKEAIKSLKTLSDYALQHNDCEGCIFKPKDYDWNKLKDGDLVIVKRDYWIGYELRIA